ncbi:helix-turn-helix domain-containing protein [Phormidium sp. CLA17]|uniref:helix-turn-helix domain-containing protein n=1 Tax=Leptolyngbya sp. Cla-17 TaxID=2803751 RepID=UPI0014916C88|nr:helix-turn-helix domain-containing protein [Leptolyngbya sp. Cla-17]MBM0740537.1 helix-turn-helix domain-containing protein [Leptolyngbya sp. Cla-17]
MIAKKLSDSEKHEVIELYRQLGETTSTVAGRYSVSTSTISRILKSTLPPDEYEALIQQKRQSARSPEDLPLLQTPAVNGLSESPKLIKSKPVIVTAEPEAAESETVVMEQPIVLETANAQPVVESAIIESIEEPIAAPVEQPVAVKPSDLKSGPILKRRSPIVVPNDEDESELDVSARREDSLGLTVEASTGKTFESEAEVLKEILAEEILDLDEEDDLDDDLEEDDDLEDDDDFEDGLPKPLFGTNKLADGAIIQILPLAEALIPHTCYLVIDRASELIAPPLRDFGDLGQIPEEETQNKILPVFDNHRIAKRYSNPRTQRVIKLPDGKILQKTYSHLKAKGISRLLIDGRVYALTVSEE